MAEQKKHEMQTDISNLRQNCEELEGDVARLELEINDMINKDWDELGNERKSHGEQVEYLVALN